MSYVCPSMNDINRLVISVDVEDWPQSTWDHSLPITNRAANNTERLLDILDYHNQSTTMFVLGKFAEKFPHIVRRIASSGHEVASHGYGHVEIFSQTPDEFRADIVKSKHLLEDIIGQPVLGYRAPDFSIIETNLWALDILAEVGFQYDSSIFPVQNKRYGIHWWPTDLVQVKLPSGNSIIELPPTTITLFNHHWPVAGGGYHRLLPWPVIKRAITYQLHQTKPFVFYCHPYEFDVNEFSEIGLNIPLKTRLYQGLGRGGFRTKFIRMLAKFETILAFDLALNFEWADYCFFLRNHK